MVINLLLIAFTYACICGHSEPLLKRINVKGLCQNVLSIVFNWTVVL